MNFKNLNIGTRLALGFGMVLALLVVLIVIGVSSLAGSNARLKDIVEDNNAKADAASQMRDAQRRAAIATRNVLLLTDDSDMAKEDDKANKAKADYAKASAVLERTVSSESGKAILARSKAGEAEAMPMLDKTRQLKRQNKGDEALEVLFKQIPPAAKWVDALEDMIERQAKLNEESAQQAATDYANARLLLLVVGALSIVAGLLVAWRTSRSVTRPLREAVSIAQTVAAGDLTTRIEVTSKDETGQLLLALKNMNASLFSIVGQVRTGTDAIATASGEIASGNLDLSARTEQQASALEETASSMEEMTSTVKQNAENARQANQLAASASVVAVKGGSVVAQVVDTMGAIHESSR